MRRLFLPAAALLLWGAASTAFADYLIIRVVLRPLGPVPGSTSASPGLPGQPPPGGGGAQPPPGGGGFRPSPPGAPASPGAPGRPGGPPPGNGGMPGGGNLSNLNLKPNDYVTAVVEIKKVIPVVRKERVGNLPMGIKTKWGTTYLYQDRSEILVDEAMIPQVRGRALPMATPIQSFEKRRANSTGQRTPETLLNFAEFALTRGLPEKCAQCIEECAAMVETKDKDGNTGGSTSRIDKVIAAYRQIKPLLESSNAKESTARRWSQSMNFPIIKTSAHYAVIAQEGTDVDADSHQRRLDDFEKVYKEFYLWFALRGRALPELKEKLVCAVLSSPEKFRDHRQAFEVEELIDDGFMLREHNLAVVSQQRLDGPSRNFRSSISGPVYRDANQKWELNRDDLLQGKFPKGVVTISRTGGPTVSESARAQVVALVDISLQEEAETASITHQGVRQLISATGLLSSTAPAPQWLRFGFASFFETPKGPFHHKSPVKVAFFSGVGGPSWAYMKAFSEMIVSKELYPNPAAPNEAELLFNAVLDEFFSVANQLAKAEEKLRLENGGVNNTVDGGGQANNESLEQTLQNLSFPEAATVRAKTIAWGLTYYLMKARYTEFEKFLNELNTLPRDVELDQTALLTAFAKSFRLSDSAVEGEFPNIAAFQGMARNWLDFMKREHSFTEEFRLEPPVIVDPNNIAAGPAQPGQPGQPPSQPGPAGPGRPGQPGGIGN